MLNLQKCTTIKKEKKIFSENLKISKNFTLYLENIFFFFNFKEEFIKNFLWLFVIFRNI